MQYTLPQRDKNIGNVVRVNNSRDVGIKLETDSTKYQTGITRIRNMWLIHNIGYAQTHVLSIVWYTEQILQREDMHVRQINGAIEYCIWTRNIFPIPNNNPSKRKIRSGLGMTDIKYKCKALYLSAGYKLFNQYTSFTSRVATSPGFTRSPRVWIYLPQAQGLIIIFPGHP
jgi:hypothetical protein